MAEEGQTYHMQMALTYAEQLIYDLSTHQKNPLVIGITLSGQPISASEALISLRRMREAGLELLPCCANVDDRGQCLGVKS